MDENIVSLDNQKVPGFKPELKLQSVIPPPYSDFSQLKMKGVDVLLTASFVFGLKLYLQPVYRTERCTTGKVSWRVNPVRALAASRELLRCVKIQTVYMHKTG